MSATILFSSPYQFKNELYSSKVKLSSITVSSKKLKKSIAVREDDSIAIEQIRFWRRKELLPFIEDGTHAEVSMAQILWIRFLQSMRNFGCSVEYMKLATDYFIKRAYDDNLVLQNFLRLLKNYEEVLKNNTIQKDSNGNELSLAEIPKRIEFIKAALNDPFLLMSLKTDINYFTTAFLIYLDTHQDVKIVLNEYGCFGVMIEDIVYDISYDEPVVHQSFLCDEPRLTFPIKHFLKDFFNNSILEESSLSIQVLNEDEKEIIKNLKDKRVLKISIELRNGEIKRYDIEKEKITSLDESRTKEIKELIGLKNYQKISFEMINAKTIKETKTIKRIL